MLGRLTCDVISICGLKISANNWSKEKNVFIKFADADVGQVHCCAKFWQNNIKFSSIIQRIRISTRVKLIA